ncbi:MAG: DUF5916 domain-containing protein [bacterium]|nr:DUF5916 domain-containing protein [bacterium]
MRPFSLLAAAIVVLAATTLRAAPSLEVHPTTTPPKIDGVISEGEWGGAAHSGAFTMVEPTEGGAVTERTEFWVTYDADTVYVAVRAHDSAGAPGVRAYSMQHDQDNGSDDIVRIVFDTFHRQNDGYYFALTAAGGKHDGLIQNKEDANDQWDAIWLGRTTIDAGGWSAEFAIPVKSLSFDPANSTWGFNVARAVRRKQEVMRWAGISRNRPTIALPLLGDLRGLTGLRQGRGIDLKPFASLTRHSAPAPGEKKLDFKPGLDLVWHVTPSLAATLTVNTDFADAEVDERQVNLGRFSLFFPEKRAFFTQDASLFTFAGLMDNPLPFFSRRIGLADDGSKVNLLAGAKVTGRAGPWTVGLLDVQIEDHAGVDSKNLLVGRAALQVLDESSVGVVFTHGDPRSNGENTLVGTDFNYTNNHVFGSKSLSAHASVQFTDSDYARGQGTAATLSLFYPNDPFEFYFFSSRIDGKYDPALGFVSRTGVEEVFQQAGYTWHPVTPWVDRVQLNAQLDWVMDLHGRVVALDHDLPSLSFRTPAGDRLHLQYSRTADRLDEPFAIRPGIVIPVGNYGWGRFTADYNTTKSRPVSVALSMRDQGFYAGHRRDYGGGVEWRPSRFFSTSLNWQVRQIRMPQGNFAVRIGSVNAVYTFSPDLQLSLLGQYDNFSDSLGVNFRLKWIVQPGNELFFIVNEGYDTSLDRFRPTQNDTSMKAAWNFRF